jgi:hypothetical protein
MIGLVLIIILSIVPIISIINRPPTEIVKQINTEHKTITDIVKELSIDFISNQSQAIGKGFVTENNLTIIFVNNAYVKQYYPDDISYNDYLGFYTSDNTRITINAEKIFNNVDNPDTEFEIKLKNTLLHEIGHYIMDKDLVSNIEKIYNADYDFERQTLNNQYYYIQLHDNTNLSDMPEILQKSIDFKKVYFEIDSYTFYDHLDETIVRLNAVCWQEKQDYKHYWQMFEETSYRICDEFNFPAYVDNNLNSIGEDIIEGYIKTYITHEKTEVIQ